MAPPYFPMIDIDGSSYFPPPYSLRTIPTTMWQGMFPLAVLATFSVGASLVLIGFMTWRLIGWKVYNKSFVGHNQYVLLVLNLLIADVQQSASFLINFHWLRIGHILSPSGPCFAQAWLLHSGDLGSGFFVLAIGIHTLYTAVYGGRVGRKSFTAAIVGTWAFAFLMTGIGVGMHGQKYFTRAGAWCWVSEAFESQRLAFHYIWIFIVQFGTILIYIVTFVKLRRKTQSLWKWHNQGRVVPNLATVEAVNRITRLMTLYPCVYVILTLPLSAGRMWSMAHGGQAYSDEYACVAGALLASCGWVDTLLYTLTRRRLLRETMPEHCVSSEGLNNLILDPKGITHTRTVTVKGCTLMDILDEGEYQLPSRPRISDPIPGFETPPSPADSIAPILSPRNSAGDKQSGMSPGLREIMSHGAKEKSEVYGGLRPTRSNRPDSSSS